VKTGINRQKKTRITFNLKDSMKKLIMTLAIAFSSIAAFAGEENVSEKVLNAFRQEFTSANQVEWATGNDYYRASFIYNNKHVFAYYDMDGQLLALTRYLSSMDLPLGLQTGLKKEYSEYWISDLFEVAKNEGTTYYITLEDADTKLTLRSTGSNGWDVFKSVKKI
jgi:hypothetical protein